MFPEEKGFSYRNIRYMRQWYSFYLQLGTNWQQAAAKISTPNWHHVGAENWQQPVAELEMPAKFALVPWGHHIQIFSKCASIEESFFYIVQTIVNNWSRERTVKELKQRKLEK